MAHSPLRHPAGVLPPLLSLAALGLVVGHFLAVGVTHDVDEGTLAHLFQLLMVAQVPVVLVFAIRVVPAGGRRALGVLALQGLAAAVALWAAHALT